MSKKHRKIPTPSPRNRICFLTVTKASAYLGLPDRTVRAMIHDKELPARWVSGRWLIAEDAIREMRLVLYGIKRTTPLTVIEREVHPRRKRKVENVAYTRGGKRK